MAKMQGEDDFFRERVMKTIQRGEERFKIQSEAGHRVNAERELELFTFIREQLKLISILFSN